MSPAIQIVAADLQNCIHTDAIVRLLNGYAKDEMGGGKELSASVRQELIPNLRRHPASHIFLAYCGEQPVGIAVCFLGFSTFAARPLLNLHDLAVDADFRQQGIGGLLLGRVEEQARALGCCKMTLEVRDDNSAARQLYSRLGFRDGSAPMRFLIKPL